MRLALLAVAAAALAVGVTASRQKKGAGYDKAVMCYFGSWSVYRPGMQINRHFCGRPKTCWRFPESVPKPHAHAKS